MALQQPMRFTNAGSGGALSPPAPSSIISPAPRPNAKPFEHLGDLAAPSEQLGAAAGLSPASPPSPPRRWDCLTTG